MSQAPVVIVQGGAAAQQPTAIQTFPQGKPVIRVRRSDRLRFLFVHRGLGITHMIFGSIAFLLSVIGLGIGVPFNWYPFFGSGVWAGLCFFVTGLLGVLAHKKESRCLVVTCMVMNIISSVIAVAGGTTAIGEYGAANGRKYSSALGYQLAKCFTVLVICIVEGIISIVFASFTCASCCPCCLPLEAVYSSQNASGAIVDQQRPQAVVVQPSSQANDPQRQVYLYQGYMPQPQNGQQPLLPGQQAVLPGQQAVLPGQQAVLPGQQAVLPGQQVVLPGQQAVLPGQQVVLPGQQAVLPGQQAVLPGQQVVLPGQQAVLPGQQAVLPGQLYSQYSTQAVYPQQRQVWSPAVNPDFTYDGASGATASVPPPYSEITEQK